jgi:uncharacterized protein YhaN
MPSAKAQDAVIRDLEELGEADDRSPETQQELAKERQGVDTSLTGMKTLKARQQELKALRQEVTQQLNAAFARGKDAAITYRSAVRAKIGPRNERLVHFKVAPLRKRPRKQKVVFVVKPPDGEASGS